MSINGWSRTPLQTAASPSQGWAVLVPADDIDLVNASALVLAAVAAPSEGDAGVVVDFRDVEFVDVVGLDALVRIRHRLRATGQHLLLRSPPRTLTLMLNVFELTDMLEGSAERNAWLAGCRPCVDLNTGEPAGHVVSVDGATESPTGQPPDRSHFVNARAWRSRHLHPTRSLAGFRPSQTCWRIVGEN
jgi:anti-anti-sigma factor